MSSPIGRREVSITRGPDDSRILVFADRERLMEAAAERITELAEQSIARHGQFTWVLSGGDTPRPLYKLLASGSFAKRIDWRHVHFFWSDERCVPPDDPESNYLMAKDTLLDAVQPPSGNVHRMHGEEEPDRAAASYERLLREFFDARGDAPPPRFDLVLLGMGADGHTASLFPGTPPLHEKTRWARANQVPGSASWRLTLTPPAINAAAQIVFLVLSAQKADRLAQVFRGTPIDGEPLPVQLIRPVRGEVAWMVDADAAAHLGAR